MSEIATITVLPQPNHFRLIGEAMLAYLELLAVPRAEAVKLQLVAEEIYGYCLSTLAQHDLRSNIVARFQNTDATVTVILEYAGPRGDLDVALRRDQPIDRTSFEALGLTIARQFADKIKCDYWFVNDVNRYSIVHPRGKVRAG